MQSILRIAVSGLLLTFLHKVQLVQSSRREGTGEGLLRSNKQKCGSGPEDTMWRQKIFLNVILILKIKYIIVSE